MNTIRNSAKAIIIENNRLLCTKNKDQFGIFYLLPGGGQKPFEKITKALKRECVEEIGAEIDIGDIVFIRDYIGKNHEFAEWDADIHQIEYMFACTLKSEVDYQKGTQPDNYQIGIEWVYLNKLEEYRLYPGILHKIISNNGNFNGKIYLGDVN